MEEHRAAEHCVRLPELDEIELIAAADNEASPGVYEHLAACPACAARMQAIADLQGRLHQRLYRLFCPSSDELAAFLQNHMIPTERSRVRQHLDGCPQCQAELAMLKDITAAPLLRPPDQPHRRVVAQPQHPHVPPIGEGSVYRAGSFQITLNVELQRGERLPRLRGAVRGNNARGTVASLICNGRVVSAAPLNEQGTFVLDDLAPGHCSLSLRLPGYEIVVESLRF